MSWGPATLRTSFTSGFLIAIALTGCISGPSPEKLSDIMRVEECTLNVLEMMPNVEGAKLVPALEQPSGLYSFDGKMEYHSSPEHLEYRYTVDGITLWTFWFSINKVREGDRDHYETSVIHLNGLIRFDFGIGELETRAKVQCDLDVLAITG